METEQEQNTATLETPPEPQENTAEAEAPVAAASADAEAGVAAAPAPETEDPAPAPVPAPAQESNFHEKRQSVRHNVRWRALILAGSTKIPVSVVDISDGGMSFAANRSLATNVQMTLAVFIPDAKKPGAYVVSNITVQVLYQVLRRHEFRFGAKFQSPSAEFLERMRAAIQRGLS